MMKKVKITKEMLSAVVSLISAAICAMLAGCRIAVGNLEVEIADEVLDMVVETETEVK